MGCGSEHAGGPLGGRSKYSCICGRSYSSGLRLIMSSSESPPPIGIDREHTRIREFLIGSVVTFYRIDRTLSCGRTGNTVGYTDVRRFPCPGCRQYRARRADSMNSQHFRRGDCSMLCARLRRHALFCRRRVVIRIARGPVRCHISEHLFDVRWLPTDDITASASTISRECTSAGRRAT